MVKILLILLIWISVHADRSFYNCHMYSITEKKGDHLFTTLVPDNVPQAKESFFMRIDGSIIVLNQLKVWYEYTATFEFWQNSPASKVRIYTDLSQKSLLGITDALDENGHRKVVFQDYSTGELAHQMTLSCDGLAFDPSVIKKPTSIEKLDSNGAKIALKSLIKLKESIENSSNVCHKKVAKYLKVHRKERASAQLESCKSDDKTLILIQKTISSIPNKFMEGTSIQNIDYVYSTDLEKFIYDVNHARTKTIRDELLDSIQYEILEWTIPITGDTSDNYISTASGIEGYQFEINIDPKTDKEKQILSELKAGDELTIRGKCMIGSYDGGGDAIIYFKNAQILKYTKNKGMVNNKSQEEKSRKNFVPGKWYSCDSMSNSMYGNEISISNDMKVLGVGGLTIDYTNIDEAYLIYTNDLENDLIIINWEEMTFEDSNDKYKCIGN